MGRFIIGADVRDCGSAEEFYFLYLSMLKHLCNRNYSNEILRIRKFNTAQQPYKKRAIEDRKRLFSFLHRILVHRQERLRLMSGTQRDGQMDILSRLIVKGESSSAGQSEIVVHAIPCNSFSLIVDRKICSGFYLLAMTLPPPPSDIFCSNYAGTKAFKRESGKKSSRI